MPFHISRKMMHRARTFQIPKFNRNKLIGRILSISRGFVILIEYSILRRLSGFEIYVIQVFVLTSPACAGKTGKVNCGIIIRKTYECISVIFMVLHCCYSVAGLHSVNNTFINGTYINLHIEFRIHCYV